MDFKLRDWKIEDAENLSKFANNKRISENLTDQFPSPYTLEDAKKFIEMASGMTPTQIFAIEVNGIAVGGIGLHTQNDIYKKNMELGYWLAEPYWGNGIITEAISQMVTYGFKTFDITRIFARPFGRNIGSQKALEKSGFILEAALTKTLFKNEKFEDELIYGIRKSDKL